MHRKHDRHQNQLGDHREQYTTDHHDQEIPLVVDHPIQVEWVVAIRDGLTSTQQLHHTVPEDKEVTLLDGGYPFSFNNCIGDHRFVLYFRSRRYILEHSVIVDDVRIHLGFRIL